MSDSSDFTRPELWLRTFPSTLMGVMSCHWTDIERNRVVPKYPGQVFHFVDLNEFRMYLGNSEPEDEPSKGPIRIVAIIFLVLLGVDLWLLWILLHRLEWL